LDIDFEGSWGAAEESFKADAWGGSTFLEVPYVYGDRGLRNCGLLAYYVGCNCGKLRAGRGSAKEVDRFPSSKRAGTSDRVGS